MAGEQGKAVLAGGAIVTAAVLATLFATRTAQAQPGTPGATVVIPDDATMQALLGILQRGELIDADLEGAVSLLTDLKVGINQLAVALSQLLGSGGVVRNPNGGVAWRTMCPAANTAYQLPSKIVPHDKEIAIKALPTNGGVVYVAFSATAATNINDSYPLIANEAIHYKIYDTQVIWISATVANEGVVCTVEQEV